MEIIFSKFLSYLYRSLTHTKMSLRLLLANRSSLVITLVTILINILSWVGVYFLVKAIGTNLAVLHYNVVFGVDLVGDANQFYNLPLFGLIIIILNLLLAALLNKINERLVSFIFLTLAMIINIFCLLALYFSYIINFS